eukprot:scaffold53609_cov58-Attheya_sp.AAC.3
MSALFERMNGSNHLDYCNSSLCYFLRPTIIYPGRDTLVTHIDELDLRSIQLESTTFQMVVGIHKLLVVEEGTLLLTSMRGPID